MTVVRFRAFACLSALTRLASSSDLKGKGRDKPETSIRVMGSVTKNEAVKETLFCVREYGFLFGAILLLKVSLALLNGHSMFTDLWVCLSSQTSNALHGEILPRSLESS